MCPPPLCPFLWLWSPPSSHTEDFWPAYFLLLTAVLWKPKSPARKGSRVQFSLLYRGIYRGFCVSMDVSKCKQMCTDVVKGIHGFIRLSRGSSHQKRLRILTKA